ncbi:MAG: tetratricopeptide repeat protein [Candidatus Hodarchaeota archaeon]
MVENETGFQKEDLRDLLNQKLEDLKELEQIGKDSNYINELSDIALIQLQLEQYDDSESNYLTCLKHFKKQKDRLGQAAVFGVLSTLNFKKGDNQKSIKFYEKAYEIYKELKQVEEQIACLIGIGNNLIKLNKLEEACDVFLECSAICSDNNDIYNFLDCLGNLIYIHEKSEDWDIVFELYRKTLKTFKELKDSRGIITSYFNLGILEKKNNKLDLALRYFKKATNLAIDANFAELIIKGLGYIGETLFYIGKVREAKNQFIRALHLAEEVKADNAIIQLRILLNTLGLSNEDILNDLKEYKENRKKEG